MRCFLFLVYTIALLKFELFSQNYSDKGQIDFSKEKPVHPYYEKFGSSGGLNCKEKQACMSNCSGTVFAYTNKYKSTEAARRSCVSDCNRIVCLHEDKK